MVRAIQRSVLVAVALLLASCRVDVVVELDVHEDGSGVVNVEAVFDEAATEAIGDVAGRLRLADFAEAGWEITGPEPSDAGEAVVSLQKNVPSPGQWQAVLDELAGAGVFRDVRIERRSGFGEYVNELNLVVDLSPGWMLVADDTATDFFEGEPFGAPIDELTGGRSIDEIVGVTVRAIVSSDDAARPAASVFTPRFDQPAPLVIAVESVSESSLPVLLRWIGYAAGALFVLATVLAVLGFVLQRRSERLRRAHPEPLTSRVPREPEGSARAGAAVAAGGGAAVRLVVLEPLTVLYQQTEPADAYVLPFVRHNGGRTRADVIMDAYDAVLVGAMTTGEFWDACGLAGSGAPVDEVFVEMRRLRSGAREFLEETQRRRIPVAAVTNDAATWSEACRERDRLTDVWPWIISAEVGATRPTPGMFEILRRETGVAYEHCLYLDTDLASLATAKSLGMKTTLVEHGGLDLPEGVEHPRVADLGALFKRRSSPTQH